MVPHSIHLHNIVGALTAPIGSFQLQRLQEKLQEVVQAQGVGSCRLYLRQCQISGHVAETLSSLMYSNSSKCISMYKKYSNSSHVLLDFDYSLTNI